MMRTLLSLASILMFSGVAWGQSTPYGDPNFNRANDWRSGNPNILTLSSGDILYEFDGSPLELSFNLSGGPAEVYLAVYSKNANPQYDGALFGRGGVGGSMLRQAGMDTLISVSAGQNFSQGANTITWDGLDFNGNPVPGGDYTYYLFALDNISNPTLVGPGANPGFWATGRVDTRQDPPQVWAPVFTGTWVIRRGDMGTNYIQNPEAWETFQIPWMNERRGVSPEFWDISFYEVDPTESNVGFIGNKGQFDATRPSGVWRVNYDPANGTILPDEEWSGSDRGFVQLENRVSDSAVSKAFHHDWVADDGLIYVGITDREAPMTPRVVGIDRATGEIASVLDLTDIYLVENDDGSTSTMGPWGIDVDDRGIYTTGFWIEPNAFPAHFSLDGDLVWINQNGDGVVDRFFGEEAEALGQDPNRDQIVNTHVKVGRWHIGLLSGFNQPYWASVVGPDGHGLFNVNLPNMPTGLGTDMFWIDNNSGTADGLYIPASTSELVHWPFDVISGTITNDASTAVVEDLGGETPDAFALGNNRPNPFNAETLIRFSIPEVGPGIAATLDIYNSAGQRVLNLAQGDLPAGSYQVKWDGRDASGNPVSSGVYIYKLQAGQYSESKQMTLLK